MMKLWVLFIPELYCLLMGVVFFGLAMVARPNPRRDYLAYVPDQFHSHRLYIREQLEAAWGGHTLSRSSFGACLTFFDASLTVPVDTTGAGRIR